MNKLIKCPQCGDSYYMGKYATTTAMYFAPIYKDGVNINPDGTLQLIIVNVVIADMNLLMLLNMENYINMTNREKFKEIFNLCISELWAKSIKKFLEWADSDYKEVLTDSKKFKCNKCGHEYLAEAEPQWDENYCFTYWEANCPKCNNLNEINDCYQR